MSTFARHANIHFLFEDLISLLYVVHDKYVIHLPKLLFHLFRQSNNLFFSALGLFLQLLRVSLKVLYSFLKRFDLLIHESNCFRSSSACMV